MSPEEKKAQQVTAESRLKELNHYRKVLGMSPVKKARGSPEALSDAINALAKDALKVKPRDPQALSRITHILPAVVAEGAYANNREAVAKTAHTTNGKTQSQTKKEARMAKAVKKATTPTDTKKTAPAKDDAKKRGGARTRVIAEGEMTLAQIADHINLTPKAGRAAARKNKAKIGKYEIAGKKYIFKKGDRDKVAAILKG